MNLHWMEELKYEDFLPHTFTVLQRNTVTIQNCYCAAPSVIH